MAEITCVRCSQTKPALPFPPFNNDFGKRIQAEICQECWAQWLKHQTMLINHNGLNLRDPEARKFLLENTDKFLFSGGAEEVDTSKQGSIQW